MTLRITASSLDLASRAHFTDPAGAARLNVPGERGRRDRRRDHAGSGILQRRHSGDAELVPARCGVEGGLG